MDKGLTDPRGIAGYTEPISFKDDISSYVLQLVHDTTFYFIIKIICFNVVLGVIIGKSNLKKHEKLVTEDEECFICGV
jgi:hypothetical protein